MLDTDVRTIVFGNQPYSQEPVPALLPDKACLKLPDESYPILVDRSGHQTQGALLYDLSQSQWDRIHFFESNEYTLSDVLVISEGTDVHAVFHTEGKVMPGTREPWSLDWWQDNHKAKFLTMIEPYMALFGKVDLARAEAFWETL